MSSSTPTFPPQGEQEDAEVKTNLELYQHLTNFVSSLPSSDGLSSFQLYRNESGWYSNKMSAVAAMVADTCFTARPSDIVIATAPKSGTTWLKALLYATVHREEHPIDAADHPFNSIGPHECVKFFELQLYTCNRIPELDKLPSPRLFSTHLPFMALPRTVAISSCKIVYMCREPKDNFISMWHFANKFQVMYDLEPLPIETAVKFFCDGITPFGPYWDHALRYWRAHLAHPEKVLFFKYEEMLRNPKTHIRKLAEFVGCPFNAKEDDVVDAVMRLCSFDHMAGLEATKAGKTELVVGTMENSSFFRRGVVGDWANHMSPAMARHIDAITEAKFKGSGLSF